MFYGHAATATLQSIEDVVSFSFIYLFIFQEQLYSPLLHFAMFVYFSALKIIYMSNGICIITLGTGLHFQSSKIWSTYI